MFRGRQGRRPRVKPQEDFDDDGDSDQEDLEHGHSGTQQQAQLKGYAPQISGGSLNELGVSWSRLRRLDLRWTEKLWSFVDALQIFALLWSLSQPWPWPRPWLSGTRWTVAINLDVVSIYDAAMTVTGAGTQSSPWGERRGYVYYAVVILLIPVGMQTLWYFRKVLTILWLDRGVAFHRFVLGQSKPKPPAAKVVTALIAFERALLLAAHLLYLPVVLAVVRLLLCESDNTLSIDPTTSCHSGFLILPAMLGCGVVVLFTLDLKKHATDAAHAVTTYRHKSDHERFLQRVEIEYALNLCNSWEADHLWMVSSFRRHAVRYRVYVIYMKLVLVLVYAFGRSHLSDQAVFFCGVITVWSMWTCTHPPYRCRSSNRLHIVLHAILWTDSLLGMMTGYGVRSAMLVARTQFRLLAALNFTGAVIAIGVVVATPLEEALERRRRQRQQLRAENASSPAANAVGDVAEEDARLVNKGHASSTRDYFQRQDGVFPTYQPHDVRADAVVVHPDRWPTRATLASLARLPRRREWVDAIRKAKEFRFRCETCPKGLEPIRSLESFMRLVRALWAEAKAEDSALEPALSSALERLALVHARMFRDAGGRGGGLTLALEETLLDKQVLAGIRKRKLAQALMTDRQKRVMLKLLAISAFLNHRDLRDSSEASVRRLQNDTDRVLGKPLTSESRACLKTTCMQWKRLIQKSEREFEEAHGHPPYLSDKQEKIEWYERYKTLKTALENLPKPAADRRIVAPLGGFSVQRDYPELLALTPAASESLSTLIRATEQLLSSGESPGGGFEVIEAETCRKQWKRVIRDWEADFEERIGGPPDVSDKQVIRSYYEYYRCLRDLLAAAAKQQV